MTLRSSLPLLEAPGYRCVPMSGGMVAARSFGGGWNNHS